METIVIHCNLLMDLLKKEEQYLNLVKLCVEDENRYLTNQHYIKGGYLKMPYIDYSHEYRQVVMDVLKRELLSFHPNNVYRRKDIIEALLEVNQ